MAVTLPIAVFTSVVDGTDIRLGHLWEVQGKFGVHAPRWYGQPYDDLQPRYDKYRITRVEKYPLSLESATDKESSASLLASVFQALGAADIKASRLSKLAYSATVELADYEMLYIPLSCFDRLKGRPIPAFAGTGRWVIANAQHRASQGRLEVRCDVGQAAELGVDLAARGSASLNHKSSSKTKVVYEFAAHQPLAFGMSVLQIMEKGGKWDKQGKDHEKVKFLHPV